MTGKAAFSELRAATGRVEGRDREKRPKIGAVNYET